MVYFPKCVPTPRMYELTEILAAPTSKLTANGGYDLDWLENGEHIPVNGFIHDVQVAEPLLDSYKFSYSLDALAKDYGVPGKQTDDIAKAAMQLDPSHKSYKAPQELLWLMELVARHLRVLFQND